MRRSRCDRNPSGRDCGGERITVHRYHHFVAALCIAAVVLPGLGSAQPADNSRPISMLFLGDDGRHDPSLRAQGLIPGLTDRRISITYTKSMSDLNPENLRKFDGLVIYADREKIEAAQEQALVEFVNAGKGLVAIHSASYCFPKSAAYVALLGAQFKYHSTGRFRARIIDAEHPVMKGAPEFESSDETYFHTKPGVDCTILQVRSEEGNDEPVTWVRTQGKGRVFYTALGHDEDTWDNPGFQALIERAIRWSCGRPATQADGR